VHLQPRWQFERAAQPNVPFRTYEDIPRYLAERYLGERIRFFAAVSKSISAKQALRRAGAVSRPRLKKYYAGNIRFPHALSWWEIGAPLGVERVRPSMLSLDGRSGPLYTAYAESMRIYSVALLRWLPAIMM